MRMRRSGFLNLTSAAITACIVIFSSCSQDETTEVSVTGVSLDQSTLSLEVGSTNTLTATLLPADADNPSISWSSSDETVASESDGTVTGVAAGSAEITVTTEDGGYTVSC